MRTKRLLAALAMAVGTVLTAGAALAGNAAAQPTLGTLAFTPATGTDIVAISVRTSAGCSTDSDAYNVRVTGPGAFASGYLITTTQAAGFSTADPFDIFFGLTMKDAASELGTTLVAGDYLVTAQCVDEFLGDVKATFTGTLRFTTPTTYETTPGGGGPTTTTPTTTTTTDPTTTTDTTTTDPSTDPTTDPTDTTTTDPVPDPTDPPADPPAAEPAGLAYTGFPVGWVFVGGLFLVTLGGIYLVAARRRA